MQPHKTLNLKCEAKGSCYFMSLDSALSLDSLSLSLELQQYFGKVWKELFCSLRLPELFYWVNQWLLHFCEWIIFFHSSNYFVKTLLHLVLCFRLFKNLYLLFSCFIGSTFRDEITQWHFSPKISFYRENTWWQSL